MCTRSSSQLLYAHVPPNRKERKLALPLVSCEEACYGILCIIIKSHCYKNLTYPLRFLTYPHVENRCSTGMHISESFSCILLTLTSFFTICNQSTILALQYLVSKVMKIKCNFYFWSSTVMFWRNCYSRLYFEQLLIECQKNFSKECCNAKLHNLSFETKINCDNKV